MKEKPDRLKFVDTLLKNALPDDCPGDLQQRLNQSITNFDPTVRKQRHISATISIREAGIRGVLSRLRPGRLTLGSLSLAFFAAGSLMQFSGGKDPLADRITGLKCMTAAQLHLSQTDKMDSRVTVRRSNGVVHTFRIHWQQPGITLLHLRDTNRSLEMSCQISGEEAFIEDLIHHTRQQTRRADLKHLLLWAPVVPLITPSGLLNFIRGDWRISEQGGRERGDWLKFIIFKEDEASRLEILINPETLRLSGLRQSYIEGGADTEIKAVFDWNAAPPPTQKPAFRE